MLTLPKHNRYDYSVIDERPDYSWPGGKRLAVCVTTNIEVYAYRKGTGWDPAKKGEPQQQRNYAWRDYGNRVGIWRLFDLFEDLKFRRRTTSIRCSTNITPRSAIASASAATRWSGTGAPMPSARATSGSSTSAASSTT